MALEAVIDAVADVLRTLPGAHAVLTVPPNALTDERAFVVSERPGQSTPLAHKGRLGGVVYRATDTVLIDFHRVIPRDDANADEIVTDARRTHDDTRAALWAAAGHAFGGTIIAMPDLTTAWFGPQEYGASLTFGFRVEVTAQHGAEVG